MGVEDIEALKIGEKISFRVEKAKAEQLDKAEFVNIAALKTEMKVILSLEDYNGYMRDAAYPARMAGGAIAMLSLFGALLFLGEKQEGERSNRKAES